MSLKEVDFVRGGDLSLMEDDLSLQTVDMPLEDADLFKIFLADDLANIEGGFRTDFDSSLSDISLSPQDSPLLSPESPDHLCPNTSSSISNLENSGDVKIKKEPFDNNLSVDSKKRTRNEEKKNIALSREDLLKLSSKGLESYAQNLAASRALTQDEERQLKRQRRLIKNRESAQLSRLRKKIYIEELEKKLNHITQQNENLTKQVQAIQIEKKKLADEVLYLQAIIKQSPQLSAIAISNKRQLPRNVKAAGVCLLIVLFSFGLLFNASTQSNLPFGSNRREEIPEVLPKSSLFSGRVLKSIKDEESEARFNKISFDKEPQELEVPISHGTKHAREDTAEPKKTKMKISEESKETPKGLVPLDDSIPRNTNNTSYLFCPQAHHVIPANNSNQHPSKPDVVALLIPSNMLNGTLPNYSQQENPSSLLEVSCQVLSLNIWPMPNSTN
jgi:hypothetical protein